MLCKDGFCVCVKIERIRIPQFRSKDAALSLPAISNIESEQIQDTVYFKTSQNIDHPGFNKNLASALVSTVSKPSSPFPNTPGPPVTLSKTSTPPRLNLITHELPA